MVNHCGYSIINTFSKVLFTINIKLSKHLKTVPHLFVGPAMIEFENIMCKKTNQLLIFA